MKKLGRKALKQLDTLGTPDTLMRWYRQLTARRVAGQRVAAQVSEADNASGANVGVFSAQLTFVDPLLARLPTGLPLHAELERVERAVSRSSTTPSARPSSARIRGRA